VSTQDLFVPGRLCLFGEHSDWAASYRVVNGALEQGLAIVTGTDQGLFARVRPHPTDLVLGTVDIEGGARRTYRVPMDPAALRAEAEQGGFPSYVAGTALQILQRYGVAGIEIDNHTMDLPIRKGLSSSAAACVLTVRAFSRLYGLGLSVREEMELAYLGERTTPSRCGRLDQACAFGRRPVLMTFDGEQLDVRPIEMPSAMYLVIVDLGAGKDTRAILRALHRCYPVASDRTARAVQACLGAANQRITSEALRALEQGDAARVGALMTQAQEAFDRQVAPACPSELRAPRLHQLLGDPLLRPHVLGGKGVGSQGDGAAQFMARDRAAQREVIEIISRRLGLKALALTIPASHDNAPEPR